jgi:2-desacetyl-2-hydroxyethyl bacteriochlorophyllide A dehydrogenase
MKAAVFHAPQDFQICDVPYPRLDPDGVIIKVKECGICGSDLHVFNSRQSPDMLMGHEFSGDVVEIGPQVSDVKIGDRVVAAGGRGCGNCYWCRNGQYLHCAQLGFVGYALPGAFTEYCAVPAFKIGEYAARFPRSVSYSSAATAEPLAVALYAVNQTRLKKSDSVTVIGLGIIGLFIIQILKARGINQIIASGRRPLRLQLAKESGAHLVIDAERQDAVTEIATLTGRRGADVVFECAGNEKSFNQALSIVHRGGKINLVGLFENPINWDPSFLARNDLSLIGCGLRWDLPGATRLLKNHTVTAEKFVTHHFPLAGIKEAFLTQQHDPGAIKVMIDIQ